MPVKNIRGVDLAYEILGDAGPLVVVTPGGRRGGGSERELGLLLVEAGYRVLLHDRRNTGASGIAFQGDSESLEQAEDMFALLTALDTGPVYAAGCSSGARMSLLLARDHPAAVKALLLWRVTGGPYAAQRLASNYYGLFLDALNHGGMEAVCATEHFAAMIEANPINRETLTAMDATAFATSMQRWPEGFHRDAGYPVAGLTPSEMRAMTLPAIVIPGNDRIHPLATAQAAHRLLANSRYREIMTTEVYEDVDFDGWAAKVGTLASSFIDFLRDCERSR